MKPAAKLISVRAYARLRGIDQKDMLKKLKRVGWSGKVDIEKCDKLLADTRRASSAAPAKGGKGGKIPFAEAERRERLAKAKIQELKLGKIQGTLVERDAVRKKLFELQRRNRDAMLNIPSRLAGILAAETNQDAVFKLLTEEIQQALQSLVD